MSKVRRERACGRDFLQGLHQAAHQFLAGKDFREGLDGPLDLVMRAEEPQNRLDGVLSLIHEHPDDHAFLFDVLRDDFA